MTFSIGDRLVNAPSLDKGFTWLNSRPLTGDDLKGNVVLLDFWTYCCINCMHVIPDLKFLEEKYKDEPFITIGVHSAKFYNEEVAENIRNAILRYGIEHPVIVDRDMQIWQAFGVMAWPTLILVAPDGKIATVFSGEGNRDALDEMISELLREYGQRGELAELPPVFEPEEFTSPTELAFPGKVLADEAGNRLYIADSGNNRVIVADFEGKVIDIIGGGDEEFRDGSFEYAAFGHPQGLALDGELLYIADTENHSVRRADLENRTVETAAGVGSQAGWGARGGEGKRTALNSPWDLEIEGNTLYIAMAGSHQIWSLDLDSEKVEIYAGTGREARLDAPRFSAAFAQPSGLSLGGSTLYIADSEISCIRAIDLTSGFVETLVGGDLFVFGDVDGIGDTARLQHPLGVSFSGGVIYVADSYNHKIRVLDPEKREIVGFAGTGEPGYRDGTLGEALFNEPGGLDAGYDRVFVADTNSHRIRVVDLLKGEVSTLDITGFDTFQALE